MDRQLLPNPVLLGGSTPDAGHFGRLAQAVSLLDRLLVNIRRENADAKLMELDNEIRGFLEGVLEDEDWKRNLHCLPAAICVRYASCHSSMDFKITY